MKPLPHIIPVIILSLIIIFFVGCNQLSQSYDYSEQFFEVNHAVESRSISFENLTGQKGKGGMAASNIGVGRKGRPAEVIKPGQTVAIFDVKGPGVIRHIWLTTPRVPKNLLGMVIRVYWDGQKHPAIGLRRRAA